MKFAMTTVAVIAILSAGSATADQKLAQTNGCATCHAVDKKGIGPAFKDVAAKYKGDKNAEVLLVKKVKGGSTGVWNMGVMPPNAHVKDDDIKTLVRWVLSQK